MKDEEEYAVRVWWQDRSEWRLVSAKSPRAAKRKLSTELAGEQVHIAQVLPADMSYIAGI